MTSIDRRSLLAAFGLASVARVMPALAAPTSGTVTMSKPGENRFRFGTSAQAAQTPCMITSADSGGAVTIFQMNALPQAGPFLHVHHREDEWYYVIAGNFRFEAGDRDYALTPGASVWLPRGVPHVWANVDKAEGKMLLMCQPGGFEHFFDEIGSVPQTEKSPDRMRTLMAKYGMEMLGPPLFASSWMRQH